MSEKVKKQLDKEELNDYLWRLYVEATDEGVFIHMHPNIRGAIDVMASILVQDEEFRFIVETALKRIKHEAENN